MNKSEITHAIHQRLSAKVTLIQIDLVVDTLLDVISEGLQRGDEVQMGEFGTFALASAVVKPALRTAIRKRK